MTRSPAVHLLRALLAAALVGPAIAHAGAVSVLAKTGDVADDGLAVDAITSPVAGSAADAAFFGETSAILLRQGTITTVVAKTGAPVPGRPGTFNTFSAPAINPAGTVIAFGATLNGDVPGGLFRVENGAIVPVLAGDAAPDLIGVNGPGDLVFRQAGSALFFLARAGGAPVQIVSLDDPILGTRRRGRFVNPPVVADDGRVAFTVDPRTQAGGGVFTWTAAGGVVPIGRDGDASPLAGRTFSATRRQTAAINAAGQIAFTSPLSGGSDDAVFAWDPGTGQTRVVASAGTVVDGSGLTGVDVEYVGIDDAGRVAFEGRFGPARRLVLAAGATFTTLAPIESSALDFASSLTPGGRIAWLRDGNLETFDGTRRVVLTPADVPLGSGFTLAGPATSDADVTVCAASRAGLYRVHDGALRVVVRDGQTVGSVGPISLTAVSDGAAVYRGDALAFVATDANGNKLLALDGGGALTKIVADGEATPLGGTFAVLPDVQLDVHGRTIVFVANVVEGVSQWTGLLKLQLGGRPARVLVRTGDGVRGGGTLGSLAFLGGTKAPVFSGTLTDGRDGLFTLRGKHAVSIARRGDAAPGAGVFGPVLDAALADDKVVFTAALGATDPAPQGVFIARHGKPQKIAVTGDVAPGGGTFATFKNVGLAGKDVVFGATIDDAGTTKTAIYRGRRKHLRRLAVGGDALGTGATLSLDGLGDVAVDGQTVGFVGGENETNVAHSGVFEIGRTGIATVALSGLASPIGGTYGALLDDGLAPADGALVFVADLDGAAQARTALFVSTHDGR